MLTMDDERMLDRHERQWLEEPDDYESDDYEDRDDEEREHIEKVVKIFDDEFNANFEYWKER